MKHHVPGYCINVLNRVQVDADGHDHAVRVRDRRRPRARPSSATRTSTRSGTAPTRSDLRRGMPTWDFPSLCKTCMFTDQARPEVYLPFVAERARASSGARAAMDCTLSDRGAAHMHAASGAARRSRWRGRPRRSSDGCWRSRWAASGEQVELHAASGSAREGSVVRRLRSREATGRRCARTSATGGRVRA